MRATQQQLWLVVDPTVNCGVRGAHTALHTTQTAAVRARSRTHLHQRFLLCITASSTVDGAALPTVVSACAHTHALGL